VIYSIKNRIITVADPGKGIVRYSMDDFVQFGPVGLFCWSPAKLSKRGLYPKYDGEIAGFLKPLKKPYCVYF